MTDECTEQVPQMWTPSKSYKGKVESEILNRSEAASYASHIHSDDTAPGEGSDIFPKEDKIESREDKVQGPLHNFMEILSKRVESYSSGADSSTKTDQDTAEVMETSEKEVDNLVQRVRQNDSCRRAKKRLGTHFNFTKEDKRKSREDKVQGPLHNFMEILSKRQSYSETTDEDVRKNDCYRAKKILAIRNTNYVKLLTEMVTLSDLIVKKWNGVEKKDEDV